MASRRYPLEPLRRMRADEVDAKAKDLAEAARNRAAAEAERCSLEKAHEVLVAKTEGELDAERKRLEAGELRIEDLQRNALYRIRVEQEKASSSEAIAAAREAESRAHEVEASRREELARKKAEAEALLRDRERWVKNEERRAAAREDEAAEEVFAARAHRNLRGKPA